MILTDVIPQKKVQKRKSKKSTLLIDKVKQSEAELVQLLNLSNKYLDENDVYENMNKAVRKVDQSSTSDRYAFFKENGFLPKELEQDSCISLRKSYYNDNTGVRMNNTKLEDFICKLDRTPKAQLSNMKDIGEKLNLSIIPFKYASENSYRNEYGVESFARECLLNDYDCYMLGPINYLDVWKCIIDKKELSQMWTNQKHQPVLDAVSLSIPSFKNVLSRIEALEENVDSCKSDSLNLQKQIDNVCDRVNANERKILKMEADQKQLQQEFERVETQRKKDAEVYRTPWIALDPILFAVPKGSDIIFDDEQVVFLGPCWGPEFPDLMAELKGLTVNKQLGTATNKRVAKIWK